MIIDGQDGNGNLYNGIWFDQVDQVSYMDFQARAQNDAVRVDGNAGSGPKADLYLGGGFKIMSSGVGLHIGGAFGGLYVDQGDIIGNDINVLDDTALVSQNNRELFFGSNLAIDFAAAGPNVLVDDTLGAETIEFSGTWASSSHTASGIWIESNPSGAVTITGGRYFNNDTDGIRIDDTTTHVTITGASITSNSGYGVNQTASGTNVIISSNEIHGNGLGSVSANGAPGLLSFSNGDVGIGTTTPAQNLRCTGQYSSEFGRRNGQPNCASLRHEF